MSEMPLLKVLERHGDVIDRYSKREKFTAGDYVFREGETCGDRAYIILSGEVSVLRQVRSTEKELAAIGKGEILGEVALFSVGPRTATAKAASDVEAIMIPRESFEKLRSEQLPVAYELLEAILNVVAGRLRTTIQRFEVIYFWLS